MADAGMIFFGHSLVVTITPEGGSAVGIGLLQSCKITKTAKVARAYGAASVKRAAIHQSEVEIKIEASMLQFDPELIGNILGTWSDVTGAGSLEDSASMTEFGVTGTVTDTSGDDYEITLTNVVFPEQVILDAQKDNYMATNVTGYGDSASFTSPAS